MNKVMTKRLISLSRIYIVIFAFALVSLMYKLDASDLGKDIKSLDLIETIGGNEIRYAYEDGTIFSQLLNWLDENDPRLASQNRDARQDITNILIANSISEAQLEDVKGLSFQPNEFSLIEIVIEDESTKNLVITSNSQTVNDLLDGFDAKTTSRPMRVVTTMIDRQLPEFSSPSDECYPLDLISVFLHGDVVEILFRQDVGISQYDPCEVKDSLTVQTEQIDGSSVYALLNGEMPLIDELVNDIEQQDRLRAIYGNMKPAIAQRIAAEDFARAFQSVTIFGFSVSARRFPIAIVLLVLSTAVGILWIIETAKRSSERILSDVQDEDVFDMLLDNILVRAILWVALPLLSILASMPPFSLGKTAIEFINVSVIATSFLGILSVIRSMKL